MLKKLLFPGALLAFAAALNAQTVIWEENFDASATVPAGWTQQYNTGSDGWKVGTSTALSSQYWTIPANGTGNLMATNDDKCNCNKGKDRIILPVLDLSAYPDTALYLVYDLYFGKRFYGGVYESLLGYASTDGVHWDTLKVNRGRLFWVKPSGFDVSDYAGQDSVWFALEYNDGGDWLYGAAIDNVKLIIPDNTLKSSVADVVLTRYVNAIPASLGYSKFWTGGELDLTGSVNNNGFVAVKSFDLLVISGSDTATHQYTNVNLPFDEVIEFAYPYTVKDGVNDVKVQMVNINGGGDDNDPADNIDTDAVTGVTAAAGRKVVLEEGTGTWCPWCPRGAVMMDFMAEEYPDMAIPIAVHNADPMVVSAYDAGMAGLIGGYPGGAVDRALGDTDPIDFESGLLERISLAPEVTINQNVDWDPATRKATVTSYVKFLKELNGDYRIAVVYTEDDVRGTASGYAQKNNYTGGAAGPMGGYENLPATIPAAQMVYDHVARAIVGGFTGAAGSVPATNPAESIISYESSYTLLPNYDETEMHAITLLIDQTSGQIVGAEQTPIPNAFVSTNQPEQIVSVRMFPNPVQDEATIKLRLMEASDLQLRVVDAFGRVVVERNYANLSGEQQLPFRAANLPAGSYMLTVTAQGQTVAKPFVVVR